MCLRVDMYVYVRVLCHLTVAIYRDAPKYHDKSDNIALLFVYLLSLCYLVANEPHTN